MELQAELVAAVAAGSVTLPAQEERIQLHKEECADREQRGVKPEHTHLFASEQWRYCDAIIQDVYGHQTAATTHMEVDETRDVLDRSHQLALCSVALNQAIHADVSAHRPKRPGQLDSYRSREYRLSEPLESMVDKGWSVGDVATNGWTVSVADSLNEEDEL
jgi:hypothetical protein